MAPGKKPAAKANKPHHPDYPTPRLAESEAIFLLEEPDRGPVVTTAAAPRPAGLKWTTHAHCIMGHDAVSCGPAGRAAPAAVNWRLGRRKGRVVLGEARVGPRAVSRYLFERGDKGLLQRLIKVSDRGVVQWSRHFDARAASYSARKLNGANALSGCGRMALSRDGQGRVSAATCMQWTVGSMKDKDGVVKTTYKRDRKGLVLERARMVDGDTKAVGHDGYHKVVITRDSAGRPVTRIYQDDQGFAAMDTGTGCYGWRIAYDSRGLKVKQTCLGPTGKPARDGHGVCGHTRAFDGRGCLVRQVNLKLSGGRCVKATKRFDYEVDARCGRVRRTCMTSSGKRTTCGTRQAAEFRYTRDARGRVTSIKHFRADRQPGKDTSCSAFEVRHKYDDQGNEVERSWFDSGARPIDCYRTGFHLYRNKYDDAGRLTSRRFFDKKGAATTNLGCAVRSYSYDNYDHTVETEDRDKAGALVDELGMARKRYIYDAGHRNFGMLLFDAQGEPARYRGCFTGQRCSKKAWHALRVMRKPSGAVSENLFFDRNGQLIDTINCRKELCWD